jgi:8-oxo-dGTP diphosphatase
VWRRNDGDQVEVAVVHRPKYDDWSLPKGKLEPGESELEAALREVVEETGLRCEPGQELPSSEYHDRFDRPKVVRYWSMSPVGGTFRPTREVDEMRWLTVDDAAALLTYPRDRDVLTSFSADGRAGPERPFRAGDAGPERPFRAGDAGPERPHPQP